MLELLGLLAIFLSAFCVGNWFLRRAELEPLERIALGTALGLGAIGLFVFALGVLRLLYAPLLLALVVALPPALSAWRAGSSGIGRFGRRLRDDVARTCRDSSRTETAVVAGVLLLMTLLNLSEAVTWDTCPDRYHVIIARGYLNRHAVFNQPGNMLLLYPELWESVYAVGLCFAPETPPVLHAGCALLSYLLLFGFARRLVSARAGLYAALFYGATAIIHRISPMGYNDLPMALFVVGSVYAAARFALRPGVGWAVLAGVLTGFGAGCKFTALPYALPPVLLLIVVPLLLRRDWRRLLGGAAATLACAALVILPWPLRSALETRNPFYPHGIGRFETDERYLCEAEKFHLKFDVDPRERLRAFRQELAFTWYCVTTEGCGALFIFPLAGFAWIWILRRNPAMWLVPAYPAWGLFLFTILGPRWVRYLVPALPGVVLVSGAAAGWLVDHLRSSPTARKCMTAALALAALFTFAGAVIQYRGRLGALPPLAPGARWNQLALVVPDQVEKIRFVNQHLDARSNLTFHGRAPRYRFIRVPFQIPTHWCPDRFRTLLKEGAAPDVLAAALTADGVTHVLSWEPLDERLRGYGLEVMSWHDAYLYEIQINY